MPRRPRATLTLVQIEGGIYTGPLASGISGSWCKITIPWASEFGTTATIARIDLVLSHGGYCPVPARLLKPRGTAVLAYLPADTASVRLELFGPSDPPLEITLVCNAIGRTQVALHTAIRHVPRLIKTALRCLKRNPAGLLNRLRGELSYLCQSSQPIPYSTWCKLFDHWSESDLLCLTRTTGPSVWPSIVCLVTHAGALTDHVDATRESAAGSIAFRPDAVVIVDAARTDFSAALASINAEYIAVLQAGEVLAPHALAILAHAAARYDRPAIIYADDDRLNSTGERSAPRFKPLPHYTAMLGGDLCTGVWLIRRDILVKFSPGSEAWAETLRLDAWLRLHEFGLDAWSHHVPFILTHRRADTETPGPGQVAKIIADHFNRTKFPAEIAACDPLKIHFQGPWAAQPRVSIVIPSACHSPHVHRYIASTLANTAYADFEVVIAVSSNAPLDSTQEATLAALETDSRVRRLVIPADDFNYAIVNNRAVEMTDSPLICLLNDDVAPRTADWLAIMVGHLSDPSIGIVGARLSYEDGSIQHAGVVLLPDGTGDHVHRFLPDRDAEIGNQALFTHEVSCVTGACLLTRRALWNRLGGMDESYASAFNDVDFCLRARECGQGVVFAADARLIHAESITFGKHYGPGEQDRNMTDRLRLRSRFPDIFQSDPFHSKNLALASGGCLELAVPPRTKRFDRRYSVTA